MFIYDALYGRFAVPEGFDALILTPEVRRLSQVRLLNGLSPTISALSEIRRYSHTLGVLHLSEQLRLSDFGAAEKRAFQAAVLLHDIGTPPFGHLMEYQLKEMFGWHHEEVPVELFRSRQAPENVAHQIFAGQTTRFKRELGRAGVSRDIVEAILQRKHPLSTLIFGTLDLDNLDNVARMAHGLGDSSGKSVAETIASNLDVDRAGTLRLSRTLQAYVGKWLALRRFAYETMSFDGPTVGAQAVLWRAIERALSNGLLSRNDWDLSDEELLVRLSEHGRSRREIALEYLGRPPDLAIALQVTGTLADLHASCRADIIRDLEDAAQQSLVGERVLGYVVVDSGTFSRQLHFNDGGERWVEGKTSQSTILYVFRRNPKRLPHWRFEELRQGVRERFGITEDRIMRCKFGTNDGPETQSKFNLQTA